MRDSTVTADKTDMKKAPQARNGFNASSSFALPEEIRVSAERKFGMDFTAVQVHDDDIANMAVGLAGVRAFAHGSDIYLGEGESALDEELMEHELSHVAEQADAEPEIQMWSLPVHNMIMKDAFLQALMESKIHGRKKLTSKSQLTEQDRQMLENLRKGSSFNDLMEVLDMNSK